jgi:hypothetical protein
MAKGWTCERDKQGLWEKGVKGDKGTNVYINFCVILAETVLMLGEIQRERVGITATEWTNKIDEQKNM